MRTKLTLSVGFLGLSCIGCLLLRQTQTAAAEAANTRITAELLTESVMNNAALSRFSRQKGISDAVVHNTKVWFSVALQLSRRRHYAVFLESTGDECHGCGAHISVVTFLENGKSFKDYPGSLQTNFTDIGAFGDTFDLGDKSAPKHSLKRVGAIRFNLGSGRLAVLVPTARLGQGYYSHGYDTFVFDSRTSSATGGWTEAGEVSTAENNSGECGSSALKDNKVIACFSWQGAVNLATSAHEQWPALIIHAQGTDWSESELSVVPAPDLTYQYDGTTFVKAQTK